MSPYEDRKSLMQAIEKKRRGRTLIAICTFDRVSEPPLSGVSMQLNFDLKESLYRVLKESPVSKGVDIFLYTRGGDTNSVWPLVSLIKEFDPSFEVIIPFRAHSAGTMLAIAAKKIVMTRIAELSPIDPSTGNQFNPPDPFRPGNRLGISVEDVNAYKDFIKESFNFKSSSDGYSSEEKAILQSHIQRLASEVHPLALGNVHRVHKLVTGLAEKLLSLHVKEKKDMRTIINKLTVEPYSHLHMFNRKETAEILGHKRVINANEKLERCLDNLLRRYEDDFNLRNPLFIARLMGSTDTQKKVRFIGGVVESRSWGYVYVTEGTVTQFSEVPPNVSVQLPPDQPMPLVPGLPRKYHFEVLEQKWHHNIKPEGVTV